MLAADAGIALWAAIDALLARRPLVTVKRHAPAVLLHRAPQPDHARDPLALPPQALDRGHRRPLRSRRERRPARPARAPAQGPRDRPLPRRAPPPRRARDRRSPRALPLPARPLDPAGHGAGGDARSRCTPTCRRCAPTSCMARQDRDPAALRASRKRGGESEFERLREYRRGDEFRSIDWKATARRQKIISREYQLESNQNLLFLPRRGPPDDRARPQGLSPVRSRAQRDPDALARRRARRRPRGPARLRRRASRATRPR